MPAKLQYEPRVDTRQHGYDVCAAKYATLARLVHTETEAQGQAEHEATPTTGMSTSSVAEGAVVSSLGASTLLVVFRMITPTAPACIAERACAGRAVRAVRLP